MLGRLFGGAVGNEEVFKDRHYPAANTAAVVTRAALATRQTICTKLIWSYSADPTGGRITIADGATTVLDIDITKGGPGALQLGVIGMGSINSALVITLAAGGGGVTGKLSCEGLVR